MDWIPRGGQGPVHDRHIAASPAKLGVAATLSKLTLRVVFPTTFLLTVAPRDLLGGTIVLAGLAVAIRGLRDS